MTAKRLFFARLTSVVSLSLGLFLSCGQIQSPPKAVQGKIDARDFFLKETNILSLKGEWFYYPKVIVAPTDVPLISSSLENRFFTVPGIWSESFLDRGFLAGDGFATYRLIVAHHLKGESLSFKVPEMETAYIMFVDGKKLSSNGIVSTTETGSLPEYRPKIVDFVPSSDESEIVLQISNYHHRKGGPAQIISVGRTSVVHAQQEKEVLKDMLLVGSIFFMGIYHLFLYLNRKKDPYTYWFALACLLICLRVFITGNKYITLFFPDLPWELHLKLSYLSFFLIPPVFIRYMFLLFRSHFSSQTYEWMFHIGLAFSALILLTRSSFYTYLMVPYQIFTLSCALYGLFVIFKVVAKKETSSALFLFSFIVFILTFMNDFLVNNLIIINPLMAHYGIFMMFLFQSIFIARGFSKGFVEAENLALELSNKNKDLESARSALTNLNEKLEGKVDAKTVELQNRLEQIGKDLKLAKSIVTNLIKVPDLSPFLKVDYLYQPLSEVGGDIYSVKKIQSSYFRFFLADATGHGLQAALYTMMIQSEFERLNDVATKPNDLLYYLNEHFYDKNAELQIYFPSIVVDFDFEQKLLRFSCAGMQNHVLMKKNGELVYLENTGPIVGILTQYRFGLKEVDVEKGDRLFIYTDGLFEELNETDGNAALAELFEGIRKTADLPLEEVIPSLTSHLFEKMKKNKWKDDVCLFAIEVIR
ncbi:SpoIIE family protein phosphatase [Leptospira idonii]|uniref:Serine/threonine protein phosphatase n=1 Tax=Leptospira idonii TaxID=1193500 RepID=A0A4R9M2K4_9LEPT|nr:SpoIIE family protein phosphatase [Leptospira idonii]TGN21000.1 serine/threonine protein phosphatase [Leptospira idonii]